MTLSPKLYDKTGYQTCALTSNLVAFPCWMLVTLGTLWGHQLDQSGISDTASKVLLLVLFEVSRHNRHAKSSLLYRNDRRPLG